MKFQTRVGISCAIVAIVVALATALPYDSEYGNDYGSEWLYFIGDDETTYVMNYSALPTEEQRTLLGDAYFHLYTRNNKQEPEQLKIPKDKSPINSKYFNESNDIKAITHGWMSSDATEWLQNIKKAYLSGFEDYNVITVDWSEIARNPVYPLPALGTRYVGKRTAKLLSSLSKSYNVRGRSIHLIGHSLGAQVMGYAGMFSEERVNRITGLDPARPMFELPYMPKDFRLEKSDAEFVDIIHTCGGIYGYRMSHGHADFYPNNGRARQPGCEGVQLMIEGCSHGKSCEYFGQSIQSERGGYDAFPCESWSKYQKGECTENPTKMGEHAAPDSRGDYYLSTRPQRENCNE